MADAIHGASPSAAAEEGPSLPAGIARRTGVVFVHGIGNQQPAETFLDWSGPIVELLTEWRRDQERANAARSGGADVINDPVRRGAFSFNAASPPFLEIAVPQHAGVPETSWVFTEAWWAADLRPPDIGRTIGYLRGRIRTIVSGISAGYKGRTDNLVDMARTEAIIGPGPTPIAWRAIDFLDWAQAQIFGARPVGLAIGAAGTALLFGYDVLRRVPIGPIRDFAARRMIDSFLVDWFGDLPVLIDDPVQAANVRARLAGAIRGLREQGCDAIVVVAHSGGALVTFETLLDPVYAGPEYRVDKLITLGQGLGLAWRLAADPKVREIAAGHRLVGNLARARPDLRWVDFWASFDPAPAGPLPARGGIVSASSTEHVRSPQVAAVVETGEGAAGESWLVRADVGTKSEVMDAATVQARATDVNTEAAGAAAAEDGPSPDAPPAPKATRRLAAALRRAAATQPAPPPGPTPIIEVESRPITNEMNVLTDHGGYWANDEGFLVPLVRHIDSAVGRADGSRFYRERRSRTLRIVWRRQRVSALAAWDWLCSLGAMVSMVGLAIAAVAFRDRRLADAGNGLAAAWSYVPGHEIVSGPVDGIGGLVQALAGALGRDDAVSWLGTIGPSLLGIALVFLLFYALAKVGNGRWHDWDRRERTLMRTEQPTPPDRRRTAAQAIALLGGLVSVLVAVWTGNQALAFSAWAAGAVLGLLRWAASKPVPSPDRPAG
jgi:hypothetical protein